jgi:hypothetical protein
MDGEEMEGNTSLNYQQMSVSLSLSIAKIVKNAKCLPGECYCGSYT